MQNDSGASFMFAMIVVLFIVAAIVWAFLQPGLNPLVKNYNEKASTHGVSVYTARNAAWNVGFLLAIPGFTLGGLAIAAVIRSIEVSKSGN